MPYRRTPRIQARLDATRERIVAAAVARLASGGWAAVTVAAVARDAQVATGTVYRHLDDKDALLAAAFRRAADRELEHVAAAAAGPGTPRQRLDAALRVFASRALRGRRLAYALLAEPAGAVVETERLAYRRGYRAVFARVLADGVADGSIDEHDVEVVAAALVGASGEVLVAPLAPAGRAGADPLGDPAARIDALVATCLRAVPGHPAPPPHAGATPAGATANDATRADTTRADAALSGPAPARLQGDT